MYFTKENCKFKKENNVFSSLFIIFEKRSNNYQTYGEIIINLKSPFLTQPRV